MIPLASIVGFLEQIAPSKTAADWDNVGLLLGDPSTRVQKVMTCLTVTPDSASEACTMGAQLIVTHHPIFFRSVKRLTCDTAEGRIVLSLARAGVAVYSPHTALDNAPNGINEILCRRLGLVEVMPLCHQESSDQCKVVVFVPEQDLEKVADAMFGAGAGLIGEYAQCSFRLAGTGTFDGSDASSPTVGQRGLREHVPEWRLEAVCPSQRVPDVVTALRRAHSYEEPAYDVYPLRGVNPLRGEGRLGRLQGPKTLRELGQAVKTALGLDYVQVVGPVDSVVQQVAVACGAAGQFLTSAVAAGAQVFLTGEMRFHDYLAAQSLGIGLILPGHYATERCGIEDLAERLQACWPELHVWPSRQEHDPIHLL